VETSKLDASGPSLPSVVRPGDNPASAQSNSAPAAPAATRKEKPGTKNERAANARKKPEPSTENMPTVIGQLPGSPLPPPGQNSTSLDSIGGNASSPTENLPIVIGRTPATVNAPGSSSTPAPAGTIEPGRVDVIDGDTVRFDGKNFRLVGIDTPEIGVRARC